MLKRLISRLRSGASSTPANRLKVIPRDQHQISRRNINQSALKVLYKLQEAGFEAYLVGGSVRDLELGLLPKDFDVATNATPEEVAGTFRNCRLIGRRFRLAHVYFGREIIEVATFRGAHADQDDADARVSAEGQILRDNVYGSQEDDALRRDFTINALYYSVADFTVRDYCDGLADVASKTVRMIGDPVARYKEDPVRLLRAVRFAAKLNFTIHEDTARPIGAMSYLLDNVPPARIYDESLKLLMSGAGLATFRLLEKYGLLANIAPVTARCVRNDDSARLFVEKALGHTDQRIAEGKPVTPAYLYAALLWPAVERSRSQADAPGTTPMQRLQLAGESVLSEHLKVISLPKRFSLPMREIWDMQVRLERKPGKKTLELLSHPRFRAAYDFLLLRTECAMGNPASARYWTALQEQHPVAGARIQPTAEESNPTRSKRRRSGRARRRTTERTTPLP